jgi:hypothetical protein
MRFFTPELYQQFNSRNEEEADRADAAWDEAIQAYRRHLDEIRTKFPPQVKKLAELNLHDAEIHSRVEEFQPSGPGIRGELPLPLPFWTALAMITVRLDGEIITLIYFLTDHLQVVAAPEDWACSKMR